MRRLGCCIKQMAEKKPKSTASGKWARLEWGTQLQFLHSKRFTSAIAGNKKLCVIARDAQTYNFTSITTRLLLNLSCKGPEGRFCLISCNHIPRSKLRSMRHVLLNKTIEFVLSFALDLGPVYTAVGDPR